MQGRVAVAGEGNFAEHLEFRLCLPDGGERWIYNTTPVAEHREGKIVRIRGTVQDITERYGAQRALEASEAGLARAQAIAHLGSWEWHVVPNAVTWSDEIYRIFGLSPQEFDATHEAFLSHVHPDDREFVKQSLDKAITRGHLLFLHGIFSNNSGSMWLAWVGTHYLYHHS